MQISKLRLCHLIIFLFYKHTLNKYDQSVSARYNVKTARSPYAHCTRAGINLYHIYIFLSIASCSGGHFWFPLSSKCHQLDEEHVKLLKFASWTTSSGFADFYAIQTVSPGKKPGDFSDLSCFLFMKVRQIGLFFHFNIIKNVSW